MRFDQAMRLPPDERPDAEDLAALERMGRPRMRDCHGCGAQVPEPDWDLHVCPWTYLTVEAADAARARQRGQS